MTGPRVVIVVSGKRKSGKDYTTELLEEKFKSKGWSFASLRLSAPLKEAFAKENSVLKKFSCSVLKFCRSQF